VTEFKVPELGENVASGDVAKVLVSVGDTVKKEQPVIELETDKATIEVPSSVAGVVKEVKVKKGDKVQVGAVIFTVDDGAAGNGAGKAAAAPAKPAEVKAEAKPEAPAEVKPEPKPEPRPDPKAEAKPESKPDTKVLPMPQRQAADAAPHGG